MRNIIFLITKFHTLIVFVILEIFALSFVFKTNNYQGIKYANTTNFIAARIVNTSNGILNFINAPKNNEKLIQENAKLLSLLEYKNTYIEDTLLPKKSDTYTYTYIPAKIINNAINNNNNYITINKGTQDGIKNGYGVVSSNGVVGIIVNTTEHYALIMSAISTKSNISVKHKNTNAIGSLYWNGNNPFELSVNNFSKTLPIKIKDTIVTAGFSSIFPPNLPVATVKKIAPSLTSSFYICEVNLTNSIPSLTDVYVVVNKNIEEIKKLNEPITINE
ncbi:MAG: rod shape-determining protein MreC [Chitinophagales bacterium]|nr:rod shape-determining protein MreC [Bacteroidota bacterium]